MGIEKQTTEPTSPKSREALKGTPRALTVEAMALQQMLGAERTLPEHLAQEDIDQRLAECTNGHVVYQDFAELALSNELKMRRKALQLEADLRDIPIRQDIDRHRELIIANQAVTYNQYLPATVRGVADLMQSCGEELQAIIPHLPPERRAELEQEQLQAIRYLHALKELVQQRVHFASILSLDEQIEELSHMPAQKKRLQEYQKTRDAAYASLSPDAQKVLAVEADLRAQYLAEKDHSKKAIILEQIMKQRSDHVVVLENRIINMLKGNPAGTDLPGAPKEFLPQRVYLRVLQERYNQVLDQQTQVMKSPELTDEQRAGVQKLMRRERMSIMDRMVLVTKQMSAHHVAMGELTTMQNQFGNSYDFNGAFKPFGSMTPEEVRTKVESSIDGAKEFHIGRLEAMLQQVNTSFDPNGLESLSDAGIMELVGSANRLSGMVSGAILSLVPEGERKKAIADWFDSVLPLAIRESLESGVGPDGKPLTKEQKLQKIRDVIIAFRDKGSIGKFQQTLAAIKRMQPAKTFVAQDVQTEVLAQLDGSQFAASPEGQVVTVNGQQMTINGATAYVLMLRQMKADSEAFADDYEQFLGSMENLVDIRLNLKAEINAIKQGWMTLLKALGITAAVGALLPWIVGGSATGATLYLLRKAPAIIRGISRLPATTWNLLKPSAILTTGLTALQIYRIYEDVKELGAMDRIIEQREKLIIADLKLAGFEADPPDQNARFTYKDGGTVCTVNVAELKAAEQGHEIAQIVRIGGDIVELPMILRALSTIRKGTAPLRASLPVLAAEVAIETLVYGIDQKADRTFLERCPAWLLAKIDVEHTIGEKKYGMLATTSELMLTDPITSKSGEQKKNIREKVLFCILHDELANVPELIDALYPTGMHPKNVDAFFKEDFRSVLLPYYAVRLWQLSDGALSVDDIRAGRVGGFSLAPARTPDISSVNVRRALREALVVYLEHRKEREYVHAVDALEQYRAVPDGDRGVQGVLTDVVHALGAKTAFGTPLHSLERDQLVDAQGRTRVQRLVEELAARVDRKEPLTVPAGSVPGLREDLNFASGDALLEQLIADPALRMRLSRVLPRDVGEQQNAEGKEWHDIKTFTDAVELKWPKDATLMGAIAHFDFPTSYAATAADNIRSASGKKSIKSEPGLLDAFLGASADQTTLANGLEHITIDGIDLIESDKRVGERRAAFRFNHQLTEGFFGEESEPTLVFTAGSVSHRVSRKLTSVKLPEGFPHLPLRAVFYEGRNLPGNHDMVLATYVLGDLENGRVLVLQQAAATAQLNNTNLQVIPGLLQPVTMREAERKPGLSRLLEQARKTLIDRRQNAERAARQRLNAQETKWEQEHAEGDRLEQEQQLMHDRAVERAQQMPEMLYVPGVYKRNEAAKELSLSPGEFRGHLGGHDVKFTSAFLDQIGVPSMGVHRENKGVWLPQESDAFRFSADKDGKTFTYTIRRLDMLTQEPTDAFTKEDQDLGFAVLSTPLNLSGHPKEHDAAFLRKVRAYELHRLLDLTTYRSSFSWGPAEYRQNLFAKLLPLYEKTKDPRQFLHVLLNNLLDGTVSSKAYGRILKNMESFQ
ncbi:MAG TPA: hypothetical protein DEB30_02705 [Candidatus Peribacter riflensis]|uniref:Uncharacterized protein n=1 Tax=Candidatus Peribacter riflensis TaxID=1735162 RepID=A0A0S1SS26_9BACT|nr:MAG: hypothetical protein PeribacterA2_0555 [Candidatus Peribacter riflensis]OGJ77085.1 MAG: hypothetical protein A2398_03105 [Candidatus Peribacteria bacterium RIFOXYB1_FULL_57_12]ALM11034.1 MAG: hypothetical protein PeribacterB2_0554 [Candidatus Peribacter riflensis]ALM12137.1 MAG: hypothetical protein PeribacterC2_0554 [Candidatus Peribacter riflensis]ALM13240.1 MAG: hypothetical protein PeribacterD1_0555 [Candidatus Peribacter riflensis]